MAQPRDEPVQPAIAGGFKLLREIEQLQQTAAAGVPVRHGAAEREQRAVAADVPQQRAQLHIRREPAIVRERVEKRAALRHRLRRGGERVVEIMLTVARAHGGEIVRREAEQRRAQHRDERHVLMRIVDDGEQRQHHGNLRQLVKASALLGIDGDAPRRQHPAIHRADRVRAAQEDDDVAPVRTARRAVIQHLRAAVDERMDAPRDIVRLQRGLFRRASVVPVRQREQPQLRQRAARRLGQTAAQPGVGVVVKLAQIG